MNKILVEVSVGELLDKISILQIKKSNIKDNEKLKLIIEELTLLEKKLHDVFPDNINIREYVDKFFIINSKLWTIEDHIRDCEKQKKFDQKFIELARSIYFTNDERSKIKYEINKKFGSKIIEVKSYKEY